MTRWIKIASVMAVSSMGLADVAAADTRQVSIAPAQTVDVHFQFNLSGTLYLAIKDAEGKAACVDLWWIKWPLGNIQSVGRQCGRVDLDIPGFLDLAVSAKLRAGNADKPTVIIYTADERVATSLVVEIP